MINTYNRGRLRREIEKGMWAVKCDGKYTDDYAFDAAYNFQKSDFMDAKVVMDFWEWLENNPKIKEQRDAEYANPNFIARNGESKYSEMYGEYVKSITNGNGTVFDNTEFKGYGRCYEDTERGTVCLSFGWRSYTFKKKINA